jgi:hypothetical protein
MHTYSADNINTPFIINKVGRNNLITNDNVVSSNTKGYNNLFTLFKIMAR